jgi:hypothetical protein
MVIDDFDQLGAAVPPNKADASLIVDPDAVLSSAVASKGFQPVAGWGAEIGELVCRVEHIELAECHRFDRSECARCFAVVQLFRSLVFERPDHLR